MAVQITSSADCILRQSGHALVRLNSTTLYAFFIKTTSFTGPLIACYKTTNNGTNWAQTSTTLIPALTHNYSSVSACIDSAGLIRLVYHDTVPSFVMGVPPTITLRYAEFNTSNDLFQNDTAALNSTAGTLQASLYTDCGISGDRFHFTYSNAVVLRAGTFQRQFYSNRDSGGIFATGVDIRGTDHSYFASFMIEGQSTKKPCIAMLGDITGLSPPVIAAIGNVENAASFTLKTMAAGTNSSATPSFIGAPQIIQTANGDEYVFWTGSYDPVLDPIGTAHPNANKHTHADAWSTWLGSYSISSDSSVNVAACSRAYGKGENDNNVVYNTTVPALKRLNNYNQYTGVGYTLSTIAGAPTGTSLYVKTRWANWWEPALTRVDFLIESSGDIYFDKFDLSIAA